MPKATAKKPATRIAIGHDGMPVERDLRRIAVAIKWHSGRRGQRPTFHSNRLLPAMYPDKVEHARADEVLAALIEHGTVARNHDGSLEFSIPKREDPNSLDGRKANYAAVAKRAAERLVISAPARAKATFFFRAARNIHGVHRHMTASGPVLVIPTALVVTSQGIECAGAVVVHAGRRGIATFLAGPEAFQNGTTSVDLDACRPLVDDELASALNGTYVSTFTAHVSQYAVKLAKMARKALASLSPQRVKVGILLGEEIVPERWRSFVATLKQATRLETAIWRTLYSVLDPEVRRAALRHPHATYELHQWLCGPDEHSRQRRLQASAAFPIFTPTLPILTDVIDSGAELVRPLAAHLGIPAAGLRRLNGVTWQKLPQAYLQVGAIHERRDLGALLSAIPIDSWPETPDDWVTAASIASSLASNTGSPPPARLAVALSKGWPHDRAVVDVWDAIRDIAATIVWATEGRFAEAGDLPTFRKAYRPATRAVAAVLTERGGGLKTLRRFSEKWHRDAPWITVAIRKIRRGVTGEAARRWAPLTKTAFETDAGRITWLTDEDQLAVEGKEMRHCVASYSLACHWGHSHIGSVITKGGERATVEIVVSEEGLEVRQHRTTRNEEPAAACHDIVAEFVASIRRGETHLTKPRRKSRAQRRGRAKVTPFVSAVIPEHLINEMLSFYDECLGRHVPLAEWRDLLTANAAFAADPEEQVLSMD